MYADLRRANQGKLTWLLVPTLARSTSDMGISPGTNLADQGPKAVKVRAVL